MSALAIIPKGEDYRTLAQHAENLVASGFLPSSIRTPQQAIAIITLGAELKIGPWQAINGINVIQGKPTVSPQLMLALINASGELEDMKIDGDAKSCTVTMKRRNRTAHTETFTMQDANAQGLTGKSNWNKMPAVMLKWRAVAAAARIVFPDIIIGMYTPEEVDPAITVNSEGELVGDIVITREPEQKQPTVQHVVDGSTARVVEAEADEDEQPEPEAQAQGGNATTLFVRFAGAQVEEYTTPKGNKAKRIHLTTEQHNGDNGPKVTIYTRRPFIKAGWIGDNDWSVASETYILKSDIRGVIRYKAHEEADRGYWELVSVESAPSDPEPQPPARTPRETLGTPPGPAVGKPEITIDNINDVEPPDDLPPAGKRETVFSQKSQDVLDHRTAIASSVEKYTERGHEYVRFVHSNGTDLSMTVNQFSKALTGEHAADYIDIVVGTETGNTSKPWVHENLPDLSIKYKMDGDKATIVSIAEFGDPPF